MLAQARRRVLADRIALEDAAAIAAYNERAGERSRLRTDLGALPFEGDIERAPVVLLVASPAYERMSVPLDHAFHHRGWPLSYLHPDAPPHLRDIWRGRLSSLIDAFGAQHIANSVAALPLTPWACSEYDESLRLPSRIRMLDLATTAACRGATLIVTCSEERWTEAEEVAHLCSERRIRAHSWRPAHVSIDNLGPTSWHSVCRRIEAHRWHWLGDLTRA